LHSARDLSLIAHVELGTGEDRLAFRAGDDSFTYSAELSEDERRGPAGPRTPREVKAELARVVEELRTTGLRERTERNIETFLTVADAFEADGLLLQTVDCLDDLAGRLGELAAARRGVVQPQSLITSEDDLLPYRDSHNVHVLDPTYITGAQPTDRGYRWLQSKGVATVVNLRVTARSDRTTVERLGMNYVHIPWPDECSPRLDQVDELLGAVDASAGRVFQHCLRGIGRDLTMAGCYLIARHGHSASSVIERGTESAPRWATDQHHDLDTAEPVQFALLRAVEARQHAAR